MATESRIQIDKLDNQNWGIWRRKFKALLLSKRLGGVIDGTDEDKDNSSQVLLILPFAFQLAHCLLPCPSALHPAFHTALGTLHS